MVAWMVAWNGGFNTKADYTNRHDNEETINELKRASSEFLSSVPAGIKFYPHSAPSQRAIKASSVATKDSIGSDPFANRVRKESLGPFSKSIGSYIRPLTRSGFGSLVMMKTAQLHLIRLTVY